jgi:hypothetical protein
LRRGYGCQGSVQFEFAVRGVYGKGREMNVPAHSHLYWIAERDETILVIRVPYIVAGLAVILLVLWWIVRKRKR